MKTTPFDRLEPSTPLSGRLIGVLLIAQSLLVVWAVITPQSLWLDEFGTVAVAEAGTLSQWWERFRQWPNSNIQMPLYHLYVFGWTKVFGFSEYALRLSNWPLFVLAEAMLIWTFRRFALFAVVLCLLSSFHPLVWYYLDEARPYIMVFLGAVWTFGSLAGLFSKIHGDGTVGYSPWIFAAGVVLLSGSNMVGVFWAAAAVLLASALHWRGDPALLRRYSWPYMALFAALAALAVFYAYTLTRGARATALYETNVLTFAFSGYELLGLSGLGPGRLELRAQGLSALREWLVPLCLGSIVLAAGLLHGLFVLKAFIGPRRVAAVLAALFLPLIFITAVGFLMHWRVVGRHSMPIVPVVSMLLSLSVAALIADGRRGSLLGAVLIMSTVLVSGVLMSSARHAKDDYRLAALITKEALADGQTVWWAAIEGARYYHVPMQRPMQQKDGCPSFAGAEREAAIDVSSIAGQCFAQIPAAHVIVFSERGGFRSETAVKAWIKKEGFKLSREWPAFSLWTQPKSTYPP
jgi:hypothetical protein